LGSSPSGSSFRAAPSQSLDEKEGLRTLPHRPLTWGEGHTAAVEKLDAALDEQARTGREQEVAAAGAATLTAGVELAAANEHVAARKAWLDYVEQGQ
jgi:hypothetical protein